MCGKNVELQILMARVFHQMLRKKRGSAADKEEGASTTSSKF